MTALAPRPWPPQPTPYGRRLMAIYHARRAAWRASGHDHDEFRRLMTEWVAANRPRP